MDLDFFFGASNMTLVGLGGTKVRECLELAPLQLLPRGLVHSLCKAQLSQTGLTASSGLLGALRHRAGIIFFRASVLLQTSFLQDLHFAQGRL